MRVTELILDGFKSYPVRTSIAGWDSSFNAITGLNGSGKSNILDAICFVLGIQNLTTVRAQNLLDLIYKRGQAGVTRASVTIVFNNSDKAKAPVGFEDLSEVSVTRQIALNGTSKYLICGHRSTQGAVQNLFQSVQLNINNPNFVIMQGKITKVLNMRPAEILSMIEEAAGTSMFEDKKDKAVKTMAKKEKRLDEIQELLRDEITPKLDKLREEKRAFLEYQKKSSELEKLSRLVVAYDYLSLTSRREACLTLITGAVAAIADAKKSKTRIEGEIERMEKDVKEIQKRREEELKKGGRVGILEAEQTELARGLAKERARFEICESTIEEEEKKVAELEAASRDLSQQKLAKIASTEKSTTTFNALKSTYDLSVASLRSSEDLLQTLLTGLASSSEESASSGYMGQLATLKSAISTLGMEGERAKARIEYLGKELAEKEPKAKAAEKEGKGLHGELEKARKELSALEKSLSGLGWSEERGETLRASRDDVGKRVRQLRERRDAVRSKLASLEFDYTSPSPDFVRSDVHGLVATLISIAPSNHLAATALEICAGGRLYNVVVETAEVGKALLQRGQLRKRVTLIPLDKINPNVASEGIMRTVNKVSKGEAKLAIELIGYDAEVELAMNYVFGNTLICPSPEIAKLVTFDGAIRMKSVTLEGDVYDPSGTLSGGSKSKSGGILIKVQELKGVEGELRAVEESQKGLEREWEEAREVRGRWEEGNKKVALKRHEISLLEERVGESNATRIITEVEAIKVSIQELKQTVTDSVKKVKDAVLECKRVEKEMDEFKNNRGDKLAELKAEIVKKKAEVSQHTAGVKNLQKEVQTSELELEQMEQDITNSAVELAESRVALTKTRTTLVSLQTEITALTKSLASVEAKIAVETAKLSAFAEELGALDRAMKGKKSDLADGEIEVRRNEIEGEKLRKEVKAAAEAVTKMERTCDWISSEYQTFGKEGGPYDFAGLSMGDIKKKCQSLEEDQQGMKKKVNPKVLTMIDSVEKKEKDLIAMYKQVVKDKTKIEETVAKLDDYKKEALRKTWEVVNAEFGNIFAELLPGNFSKLQPPEGMDIAQGLEVKVRLGSVWKASLTELSGGQRSLIALSLIMALLHFKPAPMYILDEIDAALDLSHTENIGRLFRTRFKGSQFIVVSLKDGLFANANVLFRTRFRDGTSIVERTTQRSASNAHDGDKENHASGGSRAGGTAKKGRAAIGAATNSPAPSPMS